jgi:hypothetical protein
MARTISFEGRQISVPDDATDEEVSQIIGGQSAAPAATEAAPEPSFMDNLMADLKAFPKNMGRALGVAGAGITEGVMSPLGMIADYPFNAASKITGRPVTTPTQELSNRFDQMLGPETKTARQVVGIPASLAINPFAALPGGGPAIADLTGKSGAQIVANKGAEMGLKVNPSNPQLSPSWMTRMLGKASSGPVLDDAISRGNQPVVDAIASRAASLEQPTVAGVKASGEQIMKAGEPLSSEMIDESIARLGKAYEAVKTAGPMVADDAFKSAASDPSVARIINKNMYSLEGADSAVAVDAWKKIRDSASAAWSASQSGSPKDRTINREAAKKASEAADAMRAWIVRQLGERGMKEQADQFVQATKDIAKAHAVKEAVIPGANIANAASFAQQLDNGAPLSGQLKGLGEFATVFPRNAKTPISAPPNMHGETNAMIGNLSATTGAQLANGSAAAGAANMGRATGIPGIRSLADALLKRESLQRAATGQAANPSMLNDKEAQARAILAWLSNQENK